MKPRLWGLMPWCGLMAAAAGIALFQQVVSDSLHFDCNSTSGAAGLAWGVLAFLVVVAGALVSWRALPPYGANNPLRRFIAHLSLMAAMLACLGIVFQLLAVSLLPGCRP